MDKEYLPDSAGNSCCDTAELLCTENGLQLELDPQGSVKGLWVDGDRLGLSESKGGFEVLEVKPGPEIRKVGTKSIEIRKNEGFIAERRQLERDLELEAKYQVMPDYINVSGRIKNLSEDDKAVIITYTLPVNALGWYWSDDINRSRLIAPNSTYANFEALGTDGDVMQSIYPFCAISKKHGLSMAVPLHSPRIFRLYCDSDGLHIAFDIGLTRDAVRFIDGVDFRFIIYKHDPAWKLRSAADIYYKLFPELYITRANKHGSWGMLFRVNKSDGGKVDEEMALDSGIVFSMGPVELSAEQWEFMKKHGIYVFRHREPWAWWHLVYPVYGPRPHSYMSQPSLEEELEMIKWKKSAPEMVLDGNDQIPGPAREVAAAAENCFLHDENGRPMRVLWHDWSQGWHSQIPLNTDPKLPHPNRVDLAKKYQFRNIALWDDPGALAAPGVSWDSLTRWTGFHLQNFRKEHFKYMEVPPIFHYRTGKVVQLKGFHDWEAARMWSREIHERGKHVMANTDMLMILFCGQFLDCAGIERSLDDRHDKVDDAELARARTLCYQKPMSYWRTYGLAGLHRALFYASGAGNPRKFWEERPEDGRKITRKFHEAIARLGAAGWQPITHAWTIAYDTYIMFEFILERNPRNENCLIERYGNSPGEMYFTVRRISEEKKVKVVIDLEELGIQPSDQIYLEDIINEVKFPGSLNEEGHLEVPIEIGLEETLALKLVCP